MSTEVELDSDLRRLFRSLLGEAAPPSDLDDVIVPISRVKGGRRPLLALSAASLVACVVLALVVLFPSGASHERARPSTDMKVDTTTPPASDPRLVLREGGLEILPDGSSRPLPLGNAPVDDVHTVVLAPDGRLIVLGSRDLMPGRVRVDGPNVEGVETRLVVLDPAGAVQAVRNVRVMGATVRLLAATSSEAILERSPANGMGASVAPGSVVAHDLATGQEREIAKTSRLAWRADVVDQTLVLLEAGPGAINGTNLTGGGAGPCRLEVLQLSGAERRVVELPDCRTVNDVRLSLDGRFAAVVSTEPTEIPEHHLAVIDLQDGRFLLTELLAYASQGACPSHCPADRTCAGLLYVGMAWSATQLRVAFQELGDQTGPSPGGVVDPAAQFRIESRSIPR